jgi:hypothetical protein
MGNRELSQPHRADKRHIGRDGVGKAPAQSLPLSIRPRASHGGLQERLNGVRFVYREPEKEALDQAS